MNLKRILGDLPERETYATRDVHRKTHGCLAGTFKVRDDLESDLAKGLFQRGATYDAVIRFSSGNPKAQADYLPDARGWRSNYSLKAPCLTTTTQSYYQEVAWRPSTAAD
jgi:catalase